MTTSLHNQLLHKFVGLIIGNRGRSPLYLSFVEIIVIIIVSVVAWNEMHDNIFNTPPFGHYSGPFPASFVSRQQQLFSAFIWPVIVIVSIAAISVVRIVRNDVLYFSRLGHFVMMWSLASLLAMGNPAGILFLYCVPSSIGLALVGWYWFVRKKAQWGDLFAIGFNLVALLMWRAYGGEWFIVFGD